MIQMVDVFFVKTDQNTIIFRNSGKRTIMAAQSIRSDQRIITKDMSNAFVHTLEGMGNFKCFYGY